MGKYFDILLDKDLEPVTENYFIHAHIWVSSDGGIDKIAAVWVNFFDKNFILLDLNDFQESYFFADFLIKAYKALKKNQEYVDMVARWKEEIKSSMKEQELIDNAREK